jgi:hypothetical protein
VADGVDVVLVRGIVEVGVAMVVGVHVTDGVGVDIFRISIELHTQAPAPVLPGLAPTHSDPNTLVVPDTSEGNRLFTAKLTARSTDALGASGPNVRVKSVHMIISAAITSGGTLAL